MAWTFPRRSARRARCRSCGADILWITMADTGARMPVDAGQVIVPSAIEAAQTGEPVPKSLVVRDAAGFGRVVTAPPAGSVGFVSHFATCPEAHKHRRAASSKTRPDPGQFALAL